MSLRSAVWIYLLTMIRNGKAADHELMRVFTRALAYRRDQQRTARDAVVASFMAAGELLKHQVHRKELLCSRVQHALNK
jgi:hypothetical protein